MATLIKATGEHVECNPAEGVFSVRELQQAVNGYFEIVRIDKENCLIVNEEGKLLGLPINRVATRLYQQLVYTDDCIVGDAIICNLSELE